MSDQYFDYDLMIQDALKGVVARILSDVADNGLKGDHHYYVAFRTTDPGVVIPDHLAARYPDEMTIVVQHRYWGLKVTEEHLEIGLSFNQKPEHLIVPFDSIIGFVDPSAQFALQFDYGEEKASNDTDPDDLSEDFALEVGTTTHRGTVIDDERLMTERLTDALSEQPSDQDDVTKVVTLDAFRKKK